MTHSLNPDKPVVYGALTDMVLEVRSDSDEMLDGFPEDPPAALDAKLAALRVQVSMWYVTHCDPALMGAIETAAAGLGYALMRLPSGAGHDGVYFSKIGIIGMIVPYLDGRSHHPEEWASPEAVGAERRCCFRPCWRWMA